jgi:CRISPR/Cas system CSM-associated protein Csm3 (group 7 of RAMP superfamily)
MNPYNFVPFPNGITRNKMTNYHGRLNPSSISGYMECELETKTKICIKGSDGNPFWKDGEQPIIPGSSIRGMIRTVCEVIGGGCGYKIEKDYGEIKDCKFPEPDLDYDHNLEACNKVIETELKKYPPEQKAERIKQRFKVCPICSLFGFTADEVVFASRINIHDTEPSKNKNVSKKKLDIKQLMGPHPHRRSFYFKSYNADKPTEGGEYLGRKFYLHADPRNIFAHIEEAKGVPITIVNEEAKFHFRVDFENLEESELDMFIFALVLEKDWCHKLGYGKPFGLGSIKISIISLQERNHDYYKDFSQCDFIDKTSDIQSHIDRFNDQLKNASFYDGLKTLMAYNPNNPNWLGYPPGYWLTDHHDGTIECYNESKEARKAEEKLKKDADEQIKKEKELNKEKGKKPKPEPPKSASFEEKLIITKKDDKNRVFVEFKGAEIQVTSGSTYGLAVGQKIKVEITKIGDKITNVTYKGKAK